MGKKKFIDKKKSATFRLVFKESSAQDVVGGPDRVFTRVDGGNSFVPGFSLDDQGSIFDDAEQDEEEEEEEVVEVRKHEITNGEQSLKHPQSHPNPIPGHLRRELVELGFQDDGYNYLQHLREIGSSGRSGSFVPSSQLRLDRLRADVKVYDASKVQIPRTEENGDIDALLVSLNATQIRAPTTKILDPEVATKLEVDDGSVCNSADELEDDFIVRANEGGENIATVRSQSRKYMHSDVLSGSPEDKEALGLVYTDEERPARLLDEQFDLLAWREYDVEDVGELDDEDPSARGCANISEFSNIVSDVFLNDSLVQEKYQTPAEIQRQDECWRSERQLNVHDDERDSKCIPKFCGTKDDNLSLLNTQSSSLMVGIKDCQSNPSEDDKDLVIESDIDENEGLWDCESIVTTYSNLENHPSEIHSPLKQPGKHNSSVPVRSFEASNFVIRLKGKQQLPVNFLPHNRGSSRVDEKGTVNSGNVSVDVKGKKSSTGRRMTGDCKEERKARKEAFKEEKRTARRAKKELKLLYKGESKRAQHGAAYSGPATIPL